MNNAYTHVCAIHPCSHDCFCMCVCMYIYVCVCVCVCVYIYIYIYIRTIYIHLLTHIYMQRISWTSTSKHMHIVDTHFVTMHMQTRTCSLWTHTRGTHTYTQTSCMHASWYTDVHMPYFKTPGAYALHTSIFLHKTCIHTLHIRTWRRHVIWRTYVHMHVHTHTHTHTNTHIHTIMLRIYIVFCML